MPSFNAINWSDIEKTIVWVYQDGYSNWKDKKDTETRLKRFMFWVNGCMGKN